MGIERLYSGLSGRAEDFERRGLAQRGNWRRARWGMVGALLCLALVAGCQSYRDGKSRTVGELTDDSAIQLKVKTQLMADKNVNGFRLNVEVKRGVVSLHGRVESEEMRLRALEITGAVKGVASVEDRLEVVPPQEPES
ncbi:MAG: BON domain-containing protein [Gammaproteobacteria bacterium]|nr:BON domain-containing protein [Gammaproteobacteria bacterium]